MPRAHQTEAKDVFENVPRSVSILCAADAPDMLTR